MTVVLSGFAMVVLLAAAAEIGARVFYRFRFLIPFRSRAIGEYPYRDFIEKTEPPLEYWFKKSFRSGPVNINRFRCRGPEPAPDGRKKRIMLIGESLFFGVKLRRERALWSTQLEKMLAAGGFDDWEVLNAGNPTYNSYQHRLLWEQELRRAKPDVLLLELGANDVSQAWMMGSRWKAGTPWPWKFIMALERKSTWWNRSLSRFCLYFFFRRRMTERKKFPRWDEELQWKPCLEFVAENVRAITEAARRGGARVAFISYAFAYDRKTTARQARSLEAIQANWKSFSQGRAEYDYGLSAFLRDKVCPNLGLPYIDLHGAFSRHPRRYQLYLDLAHFNADGMQVVAETIYDGIRQLGWLGKTEKQYAAG
jgi:lysophospholipase L1-like esterase